MHKLTRDLKIKDPVQSEPDPGYFFKGFLKIISILVSLVFLLLF